MADNLAHIYNRRKSLVSPSSDCCLIRMRCAAFRVLTIDVLPDDVLLTIFDFCVVGYQDLYFLEALFGYQDTKRKIESWPSLAHVCQRWRGIVFASPRCLNLQLFCTTGIPARVTLDVWPAFPLLIHGDVY
jgi:hypothetical protein